MFDDDVIVDRRSSKQIQELAFAWRTTLGVYDRYVPDMVWLLENVLPDKLPQFALIPVTHDELPRNSAVTRFDPPRIEVRVSTYIAACQHNPAARTILAHELGHFALHEALPKSRRLGEQAYRNIEREMSAEWQAKEFEFHFLVPNFLVHECFSASDISGRFQVPLEMANRAFREFVAVNRLRELPDSVKRFLDQFK